jgi:hypothetical protein
MKAKGKNVPFLWLADPVQHADKIHAGGKHPPLLVTAVPKPKVFAWPKRFPMQADEKSGILSVYLHPHITPGEGDNYSGMRKSICVIRVGDSISPVRNSQREKRFAGLDRLNEEGAEKRKCDNFSYTYCMPCPRSCGYDPPVRTPVFQTFPPSVDIISCSAGRP